MSILMTAWANAVADPVPGSVPLPYMSPLLRIYQGNVLTYSIDPKTWPVYRPIPFLPFWETKLAPTFMLFSDYIDPTTGQRTGTSGPPLRLYNPLEKEAVRVKFKVVRVVAGKSASSLEFRALDMPGGVRNDIPAIGPGMWARKTVPITDRMNINIYIGPQMLVQCWVPPGYANKLVTVEYMSTIAWEDVAMGRRPTVGWHETS